MFEFIKYEVTKVKETGPVDMIKLLLDDGASFLSSNTSLGFIPKQGSSSVSEYVLMEGDKVKYLLEVGIGEMVIAEKNNETCLSRVIGKEKIEVPRSTLISVKTGRSLYGFYPQIYSTFSLNGDKIGGMPINEIKVWDIIECFDDTLQLGTHFGNKLSKEWIIER